MKLITTTTTIAASPEKLWSILVDFDAYADWNPFIRSITGTARAGERVKVVIAPPGGREMTFVPRLAVVDAGRELRWLGRLLLPGIFDGEHSFTIQSEGHGVHFRQEERFSGALVGLMGATMLERIMRGFEAMNDALRARAEQP